MVYTVYRDKWCVEVVGICGDGIWRAYDECCNMSVYTELEDCARVSGVVRIFEYYN